MLKLFQAVPGLQREALTLPPQSTVTPLGGGRPTVLRPEIASKILTAVRAGAHRSVAAQYAGIPRETLSRWLRRQGEPYETFARLVDQAEAEIEVELVKLITDSRDPNVALKFLERRFPKRWARATMIGPLAVEPVETRRLSV
jgi:hypothetical protein